MPTIEDVNEVAESLFKGGTRYRSEKIAVISVYFFIVGVSFVWAFSGIELGSELKGAFKAQTIENLNEQSFVLTNQSGSTWHGVRIVINDRYIAKKEKLGKGQTLRLRPEDFAYYYFVPRPWGGAEWERIGGEGKPSATAPGTVEIEDLTVYTREGRVNVQRKKDS